MTKENLDFIEEHSTRLRQEADLLMETVKDLQVKSAEITLAMRSLQMAKGWLGKFKGKVFGKNSTPYKPAERIEDIPETADIAAQSTITEVSGTHLQNINKLREKINLFLIHVQEFLDKSEDAKINYDDWQFGCVTFSMTHAEEASMWLGYELQRMRREFYTAKT